MFGMGTGIASPPWPPDMINNVNSPTTGENREDEPRGRNNMAKPRGLLVSLGCARRRACACDLSTRYCPGGLRRGRAPWDVSS